MMVTNGEIISLVLEHAMAAKGIIVYSVVTIIVTVESLFHSGSHPKFLGFGEVTGKR